MRRVLLVLIASVALLANGLHVTYAGAAVPHHAASADQATGSFHGADHDHGDGQQDSKQSCCPLACAAVILSDAIRCHARISLADNVSERPDIAPREAAAPPVRPPRPGA